MPAAVRDHGHCHRFLTKAETAHLVIVDELNSSLFERCLDLSRVEHNVTSYVQPTTWLDPFDVDRKASRAARDEIRLRPPRLP
jgi:hypothetical protein